ncbi:Uncharacterised protein [Moraxella caviae]|uniref:Uncharacterized protein n=1 Tax=Moraxella caviae TaxID=34060 RepID=A0A378R5H5_9GAMM|nr:Uncharacterised protein [Moraxella caviae]VEW12950.1 Uncharacterised protein [Moraxella caviae]
MAILPTIKQPSTHQISADGTLDCQCVNAPCSNWQITKSVEQMINRRTLFFKLV